MPEQEKFVSDQIDATKLAKEIYDQETATDSLNFDAFAFALQYHREFYSTPPKIEEILKTAKTIRKFLQKTT